MIHDYAQVIGWVLHSERLAEARLESARPHEVAGLRREVAIRRYVRERLRNELRGVPGVWQKYMVRHARLQAQRYAREIDGAEFAAQVAAARRWRDERDNGAK